MRAYQIPTGPVSTDLVMAEQRRPSSNVQVVALTANTAAAVSVPTGAAFVVFSSCNLTGTAVIPFFVSDAGIATAALPVGSVVNGKGAEFMPVGYNVTLNQTNGLSAISPMSGYLMCSFYTDPSNTSAS